MKLSIFEYKDYKRFVSAWIEQAPHKGRGLRTQLAEAIGCQTAYITHVLSGDNHLSVEQGEACARWLGLDENETDFLLLLILFQRAGTKNLEKHLDRQISQKRQQQSLLKKRINISETLSKEDQMTYYSDWIFAAVHIAVLIPELQTMDGLQTYFSQSPQKIRTTLDFLLDRGLIGFDKGRFSIRQPVLHLELDSPLLRQHHMQWRLKAMESIGERTNENLHYSGVMSLSNEDYEWLREKLSQLLTEAVKKLKTSKDEKLACLCFDWFQV